MTYAFQARPENVAEGRYWDKAWSLVEGCTPCSPGCDHCWSAAMENRFKKAGGVTTGPHFNGIVRTRPDRLDIPAKTRKPTVFSIWTDLFHEDVPDDFIGSALTEMLLNQEHTFLVLTKRPGRMSEFFRHRITGALAWIVDGSGPQIEWPPSNVFFGTTICNQDEADRNLPHLMALAALGWRTFVSIEPMLGPVDIQRFIPRIVETPGLCPHGSNRRGCSVTRTTGIDWVILGGETGPCARDMDASWARSVRDQCEEAGVPFFLKKLIGSRILDGRTYDEFPESR